MDEDDSSLLGPSTDYVAQMRNVMAEAAAEKSQGHSRTPTASAPDSGLTPNTPSDIPKGSSTSGESPAVPKNVSKFTRRRNWSKVGLESLTKQLANFQEIVHDLEDIVLVMLPDGVIRYVSPSCRKILGFAETDIVGRGIATFIHHDDCAPFFKTAQDALSAGLSFVTYLRFLSQKGSHVVVECHGHAHVESETGESPAPSSAQAVHAFLFMSARVYPSISTYRLDMFLELKIENERLRSTLRRLQRPAKSEVTEQWSHDEPEQRNRLDTSTTGSQMLPPRRLAHMDVSTGSRSRGSDGGSSASSGYAMSGDDVHGATPSYASEMAASGWTGSSGPPSGATGAAAAAAAVSGVGGWLSPVTTMMTQDGQIVSVSPMHPEFGHDAENSLSFMYSSLQERKTPTYNAPIGYSATSPYSGEMTASVDSSTAPELRRKPRNADDFDVGGYVCTDCGTTRSPEWRKGPTGAKTLCNACGLRWAKRKKKSKAEAEEQQKAPST